MMTFGVPKESRARERRVALTPDVVKKLVQAGHAVVVEAAAGANAGFSDADYTAAGATVGEAWKAPIVLKVEPPTVDEAARFDAGQTVVAFLYPARNADVTAALAAKKVTALAMDRVPRTTIAQKCDALSSMANLSGYRAVIEAAAAFERPLGAQFTAAGKTPPAKVLIIGAGVAGLAAIGAAKALGATVRAFDTRRAAADDVKSLGAEFLELEFKESGEGQGGYAKVMSPEFIAAEMALFLAQAAEVDIVVTTALVPGTKAPTLWTKAHVEAMKPGSVVVDLAAHQGGNCELSRADERVVHHGVNVLGPTDLPSRMASAASQFYAQNLFALISEWGAGPTPEHPILGPMLTLIAGEAPPPMAQPSQPSQAPSATPASVAPPATTTPKPAPAPTRPAAPRAHHHGGRQPPPKLAGPPASMARRWLFAGIGLALVAVWAYLRFATGKNAVDPQIEKFVDQLTVFVLACFVGWQVIWNVSPALHTPLMSVTNAISGIILVGGLLEGGRNAPFDARMLLGLMAILLAMINVAGGFLVTQRMLKMFRK